MVAKKTETETKLFKKVTRWKATGTVDGYASARAYGPLLRMLPVGLSSIHQGGSFGEREYVLGPAEA